MNRIATFLLLWLCWGFAIGTFLLLVPIRLIVDYGRDHGWPEDRENYIVIAFMVALFAGSFLLVKYMMSVYSFTLTKSKRIAIITAPIVLALIALAVFMNPAYVNSGDKKDTVVSAQFTIGAYPTAEKMKLLKAEGYEYIISLLHPAVVPFEPKLLAEEITAAQAVGLKVISVPMLPWVGDNQAAIDTLAKIAANAKSKYYMHCYLGKDRVNIAKKIIANAKPSDVPIDAEINVVVRSLADVKSFERGNIYKLEKEVYLIPLPTKEEYFGYILTSSYKYVVSLYDYNDADLASEAENEKNLLVPYKINYQSFNVPSAITAHEMRTVVTAIKQLPKPLVIHIFNTNSQEAELLKQLYNE